MTRSRIATPGAPNAVGPYSQAIDTGDTVYCSGQVGLDPQSGELVGGGIEAQTERVMRNLGAVLEAAGLGYAGRGQDDLLPGRHRGLRGVQRRLRPLLPGPAAGAVDVRRRGAAQGCARRGGGGRQASGRHLTSRSRLTP